MKSLRRPRRDRRRESPSSLAAIVTHRSTPPSLLRCVMLSHLLPKPRHLRRVLLRTPRPPRDPRRLRVHRPHRPTHPTPNDLLPRPRTQPQLSPPRSDRRVRLLQRDPQSSGADRPIRVAMLQGSAGFDPRRPRMLRILHRVLIRGNRVRPVLAEILEIIGTHRRNTPSNPIFIRHVPARGKTACARHDHLVSPGATGFHAEGSSLTRTWSSSTTVPAGTMPKGPRLPHLRHSNAEATRAATRQASRFPPPKTNRRMGLAYRHFLRDATNTPPSGSA